MIFYKIIVALSLSTKPCKLTQIGSFPPSANMLRSSFFRRSSETSSDEAKYVVTDYLSMENGETETAEDSEETVENANLIKAFDAETMDEPDYRDL